MRPLGRWSYAPARREPGSRQPEQYALENGLLQIPGHAKLSAMRAGHATSETSSETRVLGLGALALRIFRAQ